MHRNAAILLVVLLAVPTAAGASVVGPAPATGVAADHADPTSVDRRTELARAEFEVQSVTTNVSVGDTGTVTVRIENVGDETAENAALTLKSGSPSVTFGRSASESRFVGEWEPGEVRAVTFDVTVSESAATRSYPLEGVVNYEVDDRPRQSRPLRFGLTPDPARSFAAEDVTADLRVGERGTIRGYVENTGDATVRNAVVLLESASPMVTPLEPEQAVGTLRPGERVEVSFDARVKPAASPGSRQVTLRVRYRSSEGTPRASDPLDARVRVASARSFAMHNLTADLRVGEQGTVRATVENTGDVTVRNAVVLLESTSPMITPTEPEYAVGTLEPGESAEVSFDASVKPAASPGPRQVTLRVRYRPDNGTARASDPLDGRVPVAPARSFAVRDLTTDLRVGEEGTIRGTVVNTGDTRVDSAVVVLESTSPMITPTEPEYAVGTLEPGEAVEFAFDASVRPSASPGPRQIALRVTYRSEDGATRAGDPIAQRVRIGPETDQFGVSGVDTQVQVGKSGRLRVKVTNNGTDPVTDVSAKLFTDAPVSASDDEAFVERLAPGESVTLTFGVSMGGGAIADKTYPVKMDFQYDDADGDRRISDAFRVPVTATPNRGGGGPPIPVWAIALVVIVVLGIGAYLWRR